MILAGKVQNNNAKEQKLQRNYVPKFIARRSTSKPFFKQFRPNYPLLAQVTPINENSEQISDNFTAYIYPSSISPFHYPYYSVLCHKEKTVDLKPVEEINLLKETHLNPLHEKMNKLSEKIKNLSDFFDRENLKNKDNSTERSKEVDELKTVYEKVCLIPYFLKFKYNFIFC